jgi:hypothetical protein
VQQLADLHIPPISGTQEAGQGSGVHVEYSIKNINLKGLKVDKDNVDVAIKMLTKEDAEVVRSISFSAACRRVLPRLANGVCRGLSIQIWAV